MLAFVGFCGSKRKRKLREKARPKPRREPKRKRDQRLKREPKRKRDPILKRAGRVGANHPALPLSYLKDGSKGRQKRPARTN